nr:hypothetical protein GCM10017745_23600 [Saccharothrix mutabilis subsp. capreolus]
MHGQAVGHRPRETAFVPLVRHAVLVVAVRRRPRPARLARQHGDPVQVRVQPQVAHRAAGVPTGHDRVVQQEGVEHGGRAHAVRGGVRESAQRHGLHARDAAVVDPGDRDEDDVPVGEVVHEVGGPVVPALPFVRVHEVRGYTRSLLFNKWSRCCLMWPS